MNCGYVINWFTFFCNLHFDSYIGLVVHLFNLNVLFLSGSVKFLTLIKRIPQDPSSIDSVPGESHALLARSTTFEATVVLRGPDLSELKRVKRCLLYAIYLCYNTKLELSLAYNSFIFWPSAKYLLHAISEDKLYSSSPVPTQRTIALTAVDGPSLVRY